MKYLLLACVFACSSAHADDLTITANGLQTYYSGVLEHVETDGMSGEVVMQADFPGSYSEDDDAGPTETGLWHVVVIQPGGQRVDIVMSCSVATANTATHGGRVSMNCLMQMNRSARKR